MTSDYRYPNQLGFPLYPKLGMLPVEMDTSSRGQLQTEAPTTKALVGPEPSFQGIRDFLQPLGKSHNERRAAFRILAPGYLLIMDEFHSLSMDCDGSEPIQPEDWPTEAPPMGSEILRGRFRIPEEGSRILFNFTRYDALSTPLGLKSTLPELFRALFRFDCWKNLADNPEVEFYIEKWGLGTVKIDSVTGTYQS